jgi:serine/threonine protein kinase
MVSKDPLVGQQLANYRIEKLIGRGGMAKVYLGWDIRLQRSVAVKVIDDRFLDDPNYTERFLREARTMATWQHMNIPLVYHVGEDKGKLFFAMEYIRGQNLAQLLSQRLAIGTLLPFTEVLRIGWAIAKALDYAHQKGVIHRDVTPSNVILSEDGRVVLMDFGLALDVIQGTQGRVFGTPHYIAPEQARNSAEAVMQTDLYSMGVMLYEMLTGVTPFNDPSPIALALKHINDEPSPPRNINPHLSLEVDAVLLKALDKKPSERYQSGQALMEALEEALNREEGESQPATLAELPDEPNDSPAETLAEIPAVKAPEPQLEDPLPTHERAGKEVNKSVTARSRYLAFGGLGCGLLILMGFILLVSGISLALSRQNSTPNTSQRNLIAQFTPSPTQTSTVSRSLTPSPTRTNPTLTATPTATATPVSTPTQTPTTSVTYELLIVGNKDDSLFVVNQGAQEFPLAALDFKNRNGEVSGEEWEVDFLESGECVTLWKKEGRPTAPQGLQCDQVGERLERSGPEKFWTVQFEVFYQGEKIGTCGAGTQTCSIEIVVTNR